MYRPERIRCEGNLRFIMAFEAAQLSRLSHTRITHLGAPAFAGDAG